MRVALRDLCIRSIAANVMVQAFFQALQSYSWGFAMIQYFRNVMVRTMVVWNDQPDTDCLKQGILIPLDSCAA